MLNLSWGEIFLSVGRPAASHLYISTSLQRGSLRLAAEELPDLLAGMQQPSEQPIGAVAKGSAGYIAGEPQGSSRPCRAVAGRARTTWSSGAAQHYQDGGQAEGLPAGLWQQHQLQSVQGQSVYSPHTEDQQGQRGDEQIRVVIICSCWTWLLRYAVNGHNTN